MSLERKVHKLLLNAGMRPAKQLGQHFLVDESDLAYIAECANAAPGTRVLDIGAGVGNLTRALAARGARVTAVEKDERLIPLLKKTVRALAVEVLASDIRDINTEGLPRPYALVGNIPYYLTGKILEKFLRAGHRPVRIVLTVQKEVGERLASRPPRSHFLSVFAHLHAAVTLGRIIPAEHFWPRPKVDSVVVILTPTEKLPDKELIVLVRAGFAQPRKTLFNNLVSAGLSREGAEQALTKLSRDKKARAHELSIEEWRALSRLLCKK